MRILPFLVAIAAAGIGGRLIEDDAMSLAWGVMCGIACWPWIFRSSS